MSFEVGKLYTFKENEFEKSRESGRLVFKVRDPASATPYIVKPFEFQISELPSKIICRYKGNDRFEQDQNAIVPELYEVGKEYRFRVMRQDNKAAAHVSLRDDARGLTFFPVDLGKVKFERFQRITCRVVSTTNGDLKLALVKENEKPAVEFSVEKVIGLRGGRLLGLRGMASRLMANPMFDEVRARYSQGNVEWILLALEIITRNVTLWYSRSGRFRSDMLRQVRDLAVTLIEHTDYLNTFPQEERRRIQSRLSAVVLNSEDYLKAAALIDSGEDEEFITATLESLKTTGWLFKPEMKMRLMMALFTLRNSYVHRFIPQLFRIIREHHSDERFLGEFTDGFIQMLGIFIENESKFVNTSSHDALRELIEAIAIQLLLTRERDYEPWNLYRGRMYTLAMLLIGVRSDNLAFKAFNAFIDNYDTPLEYIWKDLDDINRLCHAKLNASPVLPADKSQRKPLSIFEGENATLAVSESEISVSPAVVGNNTRQALSLPLTGLASLSIFLNGKMSEKIAGDADDLSKHHLMWRDLEKTLFAPDQVANVVSNAKKSKEKVQKKMKPAVDDEVLFSVVENLEDDQFTFKCLIEDPAFEGNAVINTRDIVLYPVSPYADTFGENGEQMLFRGKVVSIRPDGLPQLSMEEDADREMINMANEDRDEENEMDAVITRDLGTSCLAVTEWGYPVLIYKNDRELQQGQKVVVRVSEVSWNKKQNKPYICAVCVEEETYPDKVANYRAVRAAFGNLLKQLSVKRPEKPQEEKPEAEQPAPAGPEFENIPDNYISEEAVNGLSRLCDALAYVDHDNITAVYTYLACSRLLALLGGDTYRAQFIELKQALVEVLSRFAIDGRVDTAVLAEISAKVKKFPGSDADLQRRMAMLNILAALDSPASDTSLTLPAESDYPIVGSLKRLVVAHNMLRGLKLNPVRAELKRSIYDLLNLNMPYVDVSRVNATEDQYHEFKESLIYPAGNKMKADEKKQGLEIAQVICGMLNSQGGTLYIGVANTGVPRGLASDFVYINNGFEEYDIQDVKDKFSLKFCSILREHIGLMLDGGVAVYPSLVSLEFDDIDDHVFAVVSVRPYRGAVRLADGSMFIRQDSSTLPVKKKADQLALEKSRREMK